MTTPPAADLSGGLPRALGDGLTLRWATPADTDAVAGLNARIFSDEPERIAAWTRALMRGDHPTTTAGDFTVVVDEAAGGAIVSTLVLISQTWAYDGIPFGVGRVEMVATEPAYRRRGLVRAQFTAWHARSVARGELVQAITGIPWYYRQFGYEMALDEGGTRRWHWFRIPEPKPDAPPSPYQVRPATLDDLPALTALYAVHCAAGLVSRVRSEREWRHDLTVRPAGEIGAQTYYLVTDLAGAPVGYFAHEINENQRVIHILELAVAAGQPWTPVCIAIGQAVRAEAEALNHQREKPLVSAILVLGTSHPAYDALGSPPLEMLMPPYAWYIRVADLPAFLRRIAPVLERRLAASVLVGYSGLLRLNLYRQHLALTFEAGRLVEVGAYEPKDLMDGDARFPDLTFLHLLFGHRSLDDLRYAFADCNVPTLDARLLLDTLFPRRPSNPTGLV